MPRMTLPPKLLPLIKKEKRYKIVIGGRGSGKSMSAVDICLMDCQTKGIKTACFREYQSSIRQSVYTLIKEEIERLGIKGFDIKKDEIGYAGKDAFVFKGMARDPEGIKSMQGFNRFLIEEAQTISNDSLKALTPTLREAGSEVWMVGNPRSSADPFSQRFIVPFQKELLRDGYYEDDMHLIIVMNYMDNPYFPPVLEQERLYDLKHKSTAEYRHIWLGDFNDEVEGSIIPVDWFNAAIDAHVKLGFKPTGAKVASFDPSDEGEDAKGYALRHGSVFTDIAENHTGDAADGVDWACERAIVAGADQFNYDADGLGAGLKRPINQALDGVKCQVEVFKGSSSPDDPEQIYQHEEGDTKRRAKTNRETFRNKRAQFWWSLRDRFQATYRAVEKGVYTDPDNMISICSSVDDIDGLRAEVCRIPRKPNNNGLIQIMSKPEMKKMQIQSPNRADCMMMSMTKPNLVAAPVRIKFQGWNG